MRDVGPATSSPDDIYKDASAEAAGTLCWDQPDWHWPVQRELIGHLQRKRIKKEHSRRLIEENDPNSENKAGQLGNSRKMPHEEVQKNHNSSQHTPPCTLIPWTWEQPGEHVLKKFLISAPAAEGTRVDYSIPIARNYKQLILFVPVLTQMVSRYCFHTCHPSPVWYITSADATLLAAAALCNLQLLPQPLLPLCNCCFLLFHQIGGKFCTWNS